MPQAEARDLLARMTLREKVGQLNQYTDFADLTGPEAEAIDVDARREHIRTGRVGSMLNVVGAARCRAMQDLALESRLGVPLAFAFDVIHGLRTQFPIPLAEAATWRPALAERTARLAAREATAAGICWTFGPNVDVSPEQRWGRVMEGAGECPYLGARFAAARVRGFQGDDLGAADTLAACAKHLAGYGYAEAGREYNTVELSEYRLRNEVLPPFAAAAAAGVATVMNGFHLLNGRPVTMSRRLQRDYLRGELDWDGVVVSDWNSIGELESHGVAADRRTASALALAAGCDVDMEASGYLLYLEALVEAGTLEEALIDEACLRVLTLKQRMGLFDDPYRYCDPERERTVIGAPDIRAAARAAAAASCVLLKNEPVGVGQAPLLPLDAATCGRVAVIGELGAETDSILGSWRLAAPAGSAVSLLQGVGEALGYAVSSDRTRDISAGTEDSRATTADEPLFRVDELSPADGASPPELRYARGPALLRADSDRVFVRRLRVNEGDETGLAEAVALARWADTVVLAVGEHGFMSGEARSRADIGLPRLQGVLAEAVLDANPRTAVVLFHGRALAIPRLAERAPAILAAWQPGTEGGRGVADVLFGRTEPTGRLPVSFPHATGQCPLSYRRMATGRGEELPGDSVWWSHYEDAPVGALYPFGHGLGYATFELRNVCLAAKRISLGTSTELSVEVTNTSARDGATTVQLYVRDPVAAYARPLRELRGFEHVRLAAGERTRVRFRIGESALDYWTPERGRHVEAGRFELYVGLSSAEVLAPAILQVTEV